MDMSLHFSYEREQKHVWLHSVRIKRADPVSLFGGGVKRTASACVNLKALQVNILFISITGLYIAIRFLLMFHGLPQKWTMDISYVSR